ncbi:RNA polymerase sigma factor [Spirosoma jeollabukense]
MGALKQTDRKRDAQEVMRSADRLSLYDRYSAIAYGIILQIIPEPELAQTVLIDVFSSPQINSLAEASTQAIGPIIRLTRAKALEARSNSTALNQPQSIQVPETNVNTEKLVFNLSFYQGYTTEEIADKLQLSPTNVLKTIYTYFKQLRSS